MKNTVDKEIQRLLQESGRHSSYPLLSAVYWVEMLLSKNCGEEDYTVIGDNEGDFVLPTKEMAEQFLQAMKKINAGKYFRIATEFKPCKSAWE